MYLKNSLISGLSKEYVDALQGRSKSAVHEAYIKTDSKRLKEIYESVMDNLLINENDEKEIRQEFNIVINVFLSGKEYNIF